MGTTTTLPIELVICTDILLQVEFVLDKKYTGNMTLTVSFSNTLQKELSGFYLSSYGDSSNPT